MLDRPVRLAAAHCECFEASSPSVCLPTRVGVCLRTFLHSARALNLFWFYLVSRTRSQLPFKGQIWAKWAAASYRANCLNKALCLHRWPSPTGVHSTGTQFKDRMLNILWRRRHKVKPSWGLIPKSKWKTTIDYNKQWHFFYDIVEITKRMNTGEQECMEPRNTVMIFVS